MKRLILGIIILLAYVPVLVRLVSTDRGFETIGAVLGAIVFAGPFIYFGLRSLKRKHGSTTS